MATDKPQVKAYVSWENYEKIKMIAKKDKRSISNQIELLIEKHIEEYESQNGSINIQQNINIEDNHGTINM